MNIFKVSRNWDDGYDELQGIVVRCKSGDRALEIAIGKGGDNQRYPWRVELVKPAGKEEVVLEDTFEA